MGAGMSRNESQAQPGWVWVLSPHSWGLGGGQGGTQGLAGRQGAVSEHQDAGQSRDQRGWAASAHSAAHQVHSCGGGP